MIEVEKQQDLPAARRAALYEANRLIVRRSTLAARQGQLPSPSKRDTRRLGLQDEPPPAT